MTRAAPTSPARPEARPQLLLWGFMGAGKSTVGAALAARRGLPFVDLDRRIETLEGATVAEIFTARGEDGFRALEARHLGALLDAPRARVVALGGGALLDPALRARALATSFVVLLAVDRETAVARTQGAQRPLLAGDRIAKAERLLAERAGAYADVHQAIDARGPVDQVVDALEAVWTTGR